MNTNNSNPNSESSNNYYKADRFAKLSEKLNQIHVRKYLKYIKKIVKFT